MTEERRGTSKILRTFGLTQVDLDRVRTFGEAAEISVEQMSDEFFAWLAKQEESENLFPGGLPESFRAQRLEYWQQFLRADVSEQYLESRTALGELHARHRLPMRAFMADRIVGKRQSQPHEMPPRWFADPRAVHRADLEDAGGFGTRKMHASDLHRRDPQGNGALTRIFRA